MQSNVSTFRAYGWDQDLGGPREHYYLFQNGDMVEFTLQSRGYTRAEMEATRTRRFEIAGAVNPEKEWLVSLGDQRSVLASRVKPIR